MDARFETLKLLNGWLSNSYKLPDAMTIDQEPYTGLRRIASRYGLKKLRSEIIHNPTVPLEKSFETTYDTLRYVSAHAEDPEVVEDFEDAQRAVEHFAEVAEGLNLIDLERSNVFI